MSVMIAAESILTEAEKLVRGDRAASYGHPYHDFSRTAGMLSALFKHKLQSGCIFEPEDIAIIMCCVKLSRQMNKPKRDNLVDLAGYAETINMIEVYRSKQQNSEQSSNQSSEGD